MYVRKVFMPASLTVLALALAACGGDDANDGTALAECVPGPTELTVTDAGREPRELMRFSPAVGDTAELDLEMSVETDVTVNGNSAPTQAGPPMVMGIAFTVDDVTEDSIELSFVYDRAEADSDEPALLDMLDSLTGISGTLSTDRSGAFLDGQISTDGLGPEAESLVEQTEQQLADLTVPLPPEPVGAGGRWEVSSSFASGGVAYCNQTTYTLVDFDGDSYELDVETAQTVQPTTIEEHGISIEILRGSASGTGRSSGSLTSPVATSGASTTTSRTEMRIEQDGSSQDQDVEVRLELDIRQR
jgi:hypothetical protein